MPENIRTTDEWIIHFRDSAGHRNAKSPWVRTTAPTSTAALSIEFRVPEEISPIAANTDFVITIACRNVLGYSGLKTP